MTLQDFHAGMRRHFKVGNAGRFLDRALLCGTGRVTLDVLAFDDWLHERHGDYEDATPEGCSMSDLVRREYGMEAEAWLRGTLD
jgi:hypothetical protein